MITITKEHLRGEEMIRSKIEAYRQLQQQFTSHPGNSELLYKMVRESDRLLELINRHHLRHAFSPQFVGQLELFAEKSERREIPRPYQ